MKVSKCWRFLVAVELFDIIPTSLCWARHIWYVYSHSHHLFSSSQMNRFNSKMQHNLWGLFTALSRSQNYALRFSHRVHEKGCLRRCARRTQSHPPSKSILIHVSIKIEHWKTRARETSWKACGRYSEMCKIKRELQVKQTLLSLGCIALMSLVWQIHFHSSTPITTCCFATL